jgi:hypothetical protein
MMVHILQQWQCHGGYHSPCVCTSFASGRIGRCCACKERVQRRLAGWRSTRPNLVSLTASRAIYLHTPGGKANSRPVMIGSGGLSGIYKFRRLSVSFKVENVVVYCLRETVNSSGSGRSLALSCDEDVLTETSLSPLDFQNEWPNWPLVTPKVGFATAQNDALKFLVLGHPKSRIEGKAVKNWHFETTKKKSQLN